MLHGFNFSKLVFLSTPVFTYSNASDSHVLQSGTCTLGQCSSTGVPQNM